MRGGRRNSKHLRRAGVGSGQAVANENTCPIFGFSVLKSV
jgi:hypothetical protein